MIQSRLLLLILVMNLQSCDDNTSLQDKVTSDQENIAKDTTEIKANSSAQQQDTTNNPEKKKQTPLKLKVKNLISDSAPIKVAIYQSNENFLLKEGRIREFYIQPTGKIAMTEIRDLEYGKYAVVVFQDLNDSGDMDKNLLGMPSEPYGLSNNYVPKLKKPVFGNCAFKYNAQNNSVSIDLK